MSFVLNLTLQKRFLMQTQSMKPCVLLFEFRETSLPTFAEQPNSTHHAPLSDSDDMSQTFAQVVERVKQLSLDEKHELLDLLNGLLIEGTAQKAKSMCRNVTKREAGESLT